MEVCGHRGDKAVVARVGGVGRGKDGEGVSGDERRNGK